MDTHIHTRTLTHMCIYAYLHIYICNMYNKIMFTYCIHTYACTHTHTHVRTHRRWHWCNIFKFLIKTDKLKCDSPHWCTCDWVGKISENADTGIQARRKRVSQRTHSSNHHHQEQLLQDAPGVDDVDEESTYHCVEICIYLFTLQISIYWIQRLTLPLLKHMDMSYKSDINQQINRYIKKRTQKSPSQPGVGPVALICWSVTWSKVAFLLNRSWRIVKWEPAFDLHYSMYPRNGNYGMSATGMVTRNFIQIPCQIWILGCSESEIGNQMVFIGHGNNFIANFQIQTGCRASD